MKKAISIVLVAVVLAVVVGSFAACNLFKSITVDEAKSNLEAAGYTVTVMTGADYAKSEENTYGIIESQLETYLYAVKGEDAISTLLEVPFALVERLAEDIARRIATALEDLRAVC